MLLNRKRVYVNVINSLLSAYLSPHVNSDVALAWHRVSSAVDFLSLSSQCVVVLHAEPVIAA